MYINKIWIQSYFGLENIEINFNQRSNDLGQVDFIIGKNGTGKTHLLTFILEKFFEFYHNAGHSYNPPENRKNNFLIQWNIKNKDIVFDSRTQQIYPPIEVLPDRIIFSYSGKYDRFAKWFSKSRKKTYANKFISIQSKAYISILIALLASKLERNRKFLEDIGIQGLSALSFMSFLEPYTESGQIGTIFDTMSSYKGGEIKKHSVHIFNPDQLKQIIDKSLVVTDEIALFNTVNRMIDYKDTNSRKPLKNINLIILKNNKLIKVDLLSEGEKQIISLLGSIELMATQNSLILMDEPDSYLHPTRQVIIGKELFSRLALNTHFLFSTHSIGTLSGLTESLENKHQVIDSSRQFIYSDPKIIDEYKEIYDRFVHINENYRIENEKVKLEIDSLRKKGYFPILTEGKNIEYLSLANNLLGYNLPVIFVNGGGKDQILGIAKTNSKCDTREGYIFDCDAVKEFEQVNKECKENSKKIVLILSKNIDSFSQIGIENMFSKEIINSNRDNFYERKIGNYGEYFEKFNKSKFLKFIEKRNNSNDFKKFIPILKKIEEFLKIEVFK